MKTNKYQIKTFDEWIKRWEHLIEDKYEDGRTITRSSLYQRYLLEAGEINWFTYLSKVHS